MKTTAKDMRTGTPVLTFDLPAGYDISCEVREDMYPNNRIIRVEMSAAAADCTIGYMTGETYLYEKKLMQPFGQAQALTSPARRWMTGSRG